MKKEIIIFFLSMVFVSQIGFAQNKTCEYNDGLIKCTYQTNQGRIDGHYISYYKNGIKKTEGTFENNYRKGKWTVWDTTGRIHTQRNYENPFTFKKLIPVPSNDKPAVLLDIPQYTLKYNKDGYIDYFYVAERMVFMSKRLWRFIPLNNNPLIFENNKILQIIQKNIPNKNITAYSITSDDFLKPLPSGMIDTANIKIIGLNIKEDWFFDTERLVSETRIIGLCPMAVNTITHDTTALYWIYFPEIRKYLAQEKIKDTKLPSYINTLDDLFFFRYFSSSIYKEENVYDRKITDYYKTREEIEKEAERIEINVIESEHDIWVSFTK